MQKRSPLVELKDITIAFGGIGAVDQVSLRLFPGEGVATSGPGTMVESA